MVLALWSLFKLGALQSDVLWPRMLWLKVVLEQNKYAQNCTADGFHPKVHF